MPLSRTSVVVAAASVFIHTANFAAASLCLEFFVTPVDDPPQLPVRFSPADHCGSAAIDHLPLVSGALPVSVPGAHTALGHASSVPSLRALFQSGVYIGWSSTTPRVTRSFQ